MYLKSKKSNPQLVAALPPQNCARSLCVNYCMDSCLNTCTGCTGTCSITCGTTCYGICGSQMGPKAL